MKKLTLTLALVFMGINLQSLCCDGPSCEGPRGWESSSNPLSSPAPKETLTSETCESEALKQYNFTHSRLKELIKDGHPNGYRAYRDFFECCLNPHYRLSATSKEKLATLGFIDETTGTINKKFVDAMPKGDAFSITGRAFSQFITNTIIDATSAPAPTREESKR